MGYNVVKNVAIRGITVCVPPHREENIHLPNFTEQEALRIIDSTGVKEKRVVDDGVTPSDLCVKAAEDLLQQVAWNRDEVDCLVYVSTNRDYLQPNTSCVIHNRLGLNEKCMVLDIPCGCPGWIYGLFFAGTLLQMGQMKKCLLLVGDTSTRMNYPLDKSSRPLFGDGGTATALEFDESAKPMQFAFSTISSGWNEIITLDGGARNPINEASLVPETTSDGYCSRRIDCRMKGMNVFSFSLSVPSKVVKELMEHFEVNKEEMDYFLCHQANKYIVDKVRKRAGFSVDQTPLSLDLFGNTSNASIPLTIVLRCAEAFQEREVKSLAVAFGTGLMCGAAHLQTNKIKIALIEY